NVKRFQKSVKLSTSGVVGAQTAAALERAAGGDPTTSTGAVTGGTTTRSTTGGTQHLGDRTLTKGAKGHDVRVLQDYLTRSGFVTDIDGAFGPGTLKSVKAFQRANNLPTTGIDDDETTFALRRLVDGGAASDSVPGLTTPGPTGSADKATLNSDG